MTQENPMTDEELDALVASLGTDPLYPSDFAVEDMDGLRARDAITALRAEVARLTTERLAAETATLDREEQATTGKDMIWRQDALAVLIKAQGASCTCGIKTPDPDWHSHDCRYRVLREAEAMIEHVPEVSLPAGPSALEAVVQARVREAVEAAKNALAFYADPAVYKPHPHGAAFDRRDLSFVAIDALAKLGGRDG